ncbi:hypothetical protein CH330_07880 [candidate division WOR-3 bacterium JGI_Cruoil_03_51_56]|uniref:Archease domain-containing protein n=1 Tax=candidate division WOR-3 bacterium JGI_Cruoil_03_51_56 TaxID=1973747 RepID=A0A235BR41_UNCW3|nr:MAG: hypothetical protein CH330_07880 [candidate division WOR-3 bacterium JGI_Cruoil_03_51_56]
MRPPHRQLNHTSDLKVEIFGRTLAELFTNAAFCLFDLMLDRSQLKVTKTRIVELTAPNLAELFLDWLRELLFLFSAHSFAVARAELIEFSETEPFRLTARLHGEDYDPARHGLKIEIKVPTYHQYRLESTTNGYLATVIFDI